MVGINPRLGQNYQVQLKKVAAQEEGTSQQQTQQAETQTVKQPAVPTLQQPTVKIPLAALQANAGVILPGNTTGANNDHVEQTAKHLGTAPEDIRNWLINNGAKEGDTLKIDGDVFIVKRIFVDKNGTGRYELHRLND